jgi:hypothetical protein
MAEKHPIRFIIKTVDMDETHKQKAEDVNSHFCHFSDLSFFVLSNV